MWWMPFCELEDFLSYFKFYCSLDFCFNQNSICANKLKHCSIRFPGLFSGYHHVIIYHNVFEVLSFSPDLIFPCLSYRLFRRCSTGCKSHLYGNSILALETLRIFPLGIRSGLGCLIWGLLIWLSSFNAAFFWRGTYRKRKGSIKNPIVLQVHKYFEFHTLLKFCVIYFSFRHSI